MSHDEELHETFITIEQKLVSQAISVMYVHRNLCSVGSTALVRYSKALANSVQNKMSFITTLVQSLMFGAFLAKRKKFIRKKRKPALLKKVQRGSPYCKGLEPSG